jgi:4-amino-4-deoxy-L-arabinose transferase-like glycosyltransferase
MNSTAKTAKTDSQGDKLIVLSLGVFTVLLLSVTVPQIGLTWDEPTYMVAAETYPEWYSELIARPAYALSTEGIAESWSVNHQHPPLSMVWSGFVWLGTRRFLDDLTAHRLGNILIAGVLVVLLYHVVANTYGRLAGLVAALALLTLPRFFFHAHLAAIDVPVTAMMFAVSYIFWRGRNATRLRWTILLGIVWGLAVATKINAWISPPLILFTWILIFQRRRYLFVRLVLMSLLGLGFLVFSWPWLYHDLLRNLTAYLGFMTTRRELVDQYYFGALYAPPPWHFPFVITMLVLPLSILLLATMGAIFMMRHQENRPCGGLLLISIFVNLAVFTTGLGQVFDNERLMMPVFPYVAALAGIGFVRTVQIIEEFLESRRIQVQRLQLVTSIMLVTFLPHLLLAYDLYPHLLSYYSEAIGGVYGAHWLGLETTYWCETYTEALSYLNTHAAPGAVVNAECQDVLIYYQLHGLLRPDLQIANSPNSISVFLTVKLNTATFKEADYVVIQNRQSGYYRALRTWMEEREPIHEVKYRGLRLIGVYAK